MRAVALAACICLAGLAAAPAAANAEGKDRVVVYGPLIISPGEVAKDVVVVDGNVTIAGRVTGHLVVIKGKVLITGSVKDDVVTIVDRAHLASTARVGGDFRYGDKKPVLAPGARVKGKVKHFNYGKIGGQLGLVAGVGAWLAVSVSALVLGLLLLWLLPRAAAAVWEVAQTRRGAAIGLGIAFFIGIPIVALLLVVTLLGIPLALLLLLALLPLYALGYTTSAWLLGRRVLSPGRGRIIAFVAGWAILRLLALIPFLGGLLWLAATVFGLGVLLRTAGRGRGPSAAPAAPASA